MAVSSRPGVACLGELLRACDRQIIERWEARVDAMAREHALTRAELIDEMPQFLAELTRAALALSEGAAAPAPRGETSEHGRQRLRDGFDVDEVVREYRLLGDVVLDACAEHGLLPSVAELRLLHASLMEGAGDAIAAYVRRRDDELRQLAGRHLAFIAHEIRNPLGTAWLAVDLLADRATDDMKNALDILRRSLMRLRKQIDATLVGDGLTLTIERAPVAIDGVLHDVLTDLQPEARARDVTLVCDRSIMLDVPGEARLLASALGNVIRNAVQFSHPGSTVRVAAWREGAQVRIDVEDRCGGLPGGYEALFTPWVRMTSEAKEPGLGLAIAKQAIDAHGGWMAVRNQPGVGCTMEIGLPCDTAS